MGTYQLIILYPRHQSSAQQKVVPTPTLSTIFPLGGSGSGGRRACGYTGGTGSSLLSAMGVSPVSTLMGVILDSFYVFVFSVPLGDILFNLFLSSSSSSCISLLFCGEMLTPLTLSLSLATALQSLTDAACISQFLHCFSSDSISASLLFLISLKPKYSLSSASILALHFSSTLFISFLMTAISLSILIIWQSGLSCSLGTAVLAISFMLCHLATSLSTSCILAFNSLFCALVRMYCSLVVAVCALMGLWNCNSSSFSCFLRARVSRSLASRSASRLRQVTAFSSLRISTNLCYASAALVVLISRLSLAIVRSCSSWSCWYFWCSSYDCSRYTNYSVTVFSITVLISCSSLQTSPSNFLFCRIKRVLLRWDTYTRYNGYTYRPDYIWFYIYYHCQYHFKDSDCSRDSSSERCPQWPSLRQGRCERIR